MSSKYTIVKKFKFDAGHRVMGHESKCRTIHGHEYKVWVYAQTDAGPDLDKLGRVIDFSVLKQKIGSWIDDKWDHTTIVCDADIVLLDALKSVDSYKALFVAPFNPTVENLASYLLDVVCPILMTGTGVEIVKIQMWETETSYVEVMK